MRPYTARDPEGTYFITSTVVDWIDLFIRQCYHDCLIDSLKHCIEHRGLNLHAYVIMTSHFHAIVSAKEGCKLPGIIRDLKRFTSKALTDMMKDIPESRREWLLEKFQTEANRTKRGNHYIVWQEGYHAKQCYSEGFTMQKLNYIHRNPVVEGWVDKAEDYVYSSARNYMGQSGVIEVELL